MIQSNGFKYFWLILASELFFQNKYTKPVGAALAGVGRSVRHHGTPTVPWTPKTFGAPPRGVDREALIFS